MPKVTVQQAIALAFQHHQAGRLAEAETLYRRILATQPNHPDALHFLGVLCHHTGRSDSAVDLIRQAIALQPGNAAAHSNLGEAYRVLGRTDEAVAAYRRAIQLNPNLPDAHNNLGIVMNASGNFAEAAASFRRALALKPAYAEAENNLGTSLLEMGQFDEAGAAFGRALALQPEYRDAQYNASFLLLLRGDFERGWPMYEARLQAFRAAERHFDQPMWDGAAAQDRRILLHAEQGYGDAIQFIRYASLLARRGAVVIVECARVLVELVRGAGGVHELIAAGDPLPPFEFHLPMLSLPLVFQTRRQTIPAEVPYLSADPARRETWRSRLGDRKAPLRIGLAWAGDPGHHRNRMRNIPLEKLGPLLSVAGTEFHSLQLGRDAEQIQRFPNGIVDHTGHIQDFADTAALMMSLDLILSVDTAVVHLAGALGRPVWTLLPFVPDWRWGLEGETTPWYPTMRLFRQPAVGDWDSAVRRLEQELLSAL